MSKAAYRVSRMVSGACASTPGGVGEFIQEGWVVDGGDAGGEGVEFGFDGGVLVVAFGELLADAVAHGVGGGGGVVAELFGLGHESFLRGLDPGELGAERGGLAVASFGLAGCAGW